MTEDLITAKEVADELRITQRWVTELLTKGELKGRKMGNTWVISRSDFEEYKREREKSEK